MIITVKIALRFQTGEIRRRAQENICRTPRGDITRTQAGFSSSWSRRDFHGARGGNRPGRAANFAPITIFDAPPFFPGHKGIYGRLIHHPARWLIAARGVCV